MAAQLITLPLRIWLRSAQLGTRAVAGAAGGAISIAVRAVEAVAPGQPSPAAAPPDPSPAAPAARTAYRPDPRTAARPSTLRPPTTTPAPPPEPAPAPPLAAAPEPEPLIEEPRHVSEEPELVREEAEPGAEDGAGASIRVIEPWNGYGKMNARDLIDRIRGASPAELAAVRLYESQNRGRRTVLEAVDRQLKSLNGSGRPA